MTGKTPTRQWLKEKIAVAETTLTRTEQHAKQAADRLDFVRRNLEFHRRWLAELETKEAENA